MKKRFGQATHTIKNGLFTVIIWLLIMEFLLRLILPVPFFQTGEILRAFYPEYKKVKTTKIEPSNRVFDVLILGGSVVASYYPIEGILKKRLENLTGIPVRIHNVAEPAHTSLDSYFKYKNLKEKSFDLVLLYHGINETRANNCPDEVFKEDYTHYSWYRAIRQTEKHRELSWTILPYTLHYFWIYLQEFVGSEQLIHFKNIRTHWMQYGAKVKTSVSFQKNLEQILQIAEEKGEQLVLMSFAYYIPEHYSLEKFINKQLDYREHKRAIEIWGIPELVEKGINVHNSVIRDLSEQYGHVSFVDQNQLIKKEGSNFEDICHFTEAGSREWVENVVKNLMLSGNY